MYALSARRTRHCSPRDLIGVFTNTEDRDDGHTSQFPSTCCVCVHVYLIRTGSFEYATLPDTTIALVTCQPSLRHDAAPDRWCTIATPFRSIPCQPKYTVPTVRDDFTDPVATHVSTTHTRSLGPTAPAQVLKFLHHFCQLSRTIAGEEDVVEKANFFQNVISHPFVDYLGQIHGLWGELAASVSVRNSGILPVRVVSIAIALRRACDMIVMSHVKSRAIYTMQETRTRSVSRGEKKPRSTLLQVRRFLTTTRLLRLKVE
ncbi:hypothetical protein EDD18DRAFT_576336 [Armillaria luteobubalina]|uniref:Uncharacterized protein n=1 Tax=Armillaria luteobubalina TaxID=153913 RepID=A0AA39UHK2_9AGAR|nr:hypothetical protein EDD18DRAFT_576336 [Armillaria luteobubalina]